MKILTGDSVIIADDGTDSEAINCEDKILVGFTLPTIDGTTCKLQHTDDGTNWIDCYDFADGLALSRTVGSSRSFSLDRAVMEGFAIVRIVLAAQTGGPRTIPLRFLPR